MTPLQKARSLIVKHGVDALDEATRQLEAVERMVVDRAERNKPLSNLPELLAEAEEVCRLVARTVRKEDERKPCSACPYVRDNVEKVLTPKQVREHVTKLRSRSMYHECPETGDVCCGFVHVKNNEGVMVSVGHNEELYHKALASRKSAYAKACYSRIKEFENAHRNTVHGS